MRYFQQIARNIDVLPLLHAIERQPELWNQHKLRSTYPGSPHAEVDDIWLRFQTLPPEGQEAQVIDEHESINYPALFALPQARPIIFDLVRRVEGERLGRVLITRLAPGKSIAPHSDGGNHAAYYDRYHVTLQNYPGSIFRAGNESVFMATGDAWWFDNGQEHEVKNASSDDRITMIVDIRTTR